MAKKTKKDKQIRELQDKLHSRNILLKDLRKEDSILRKIARKIKLKGGKI
jgi:hypothetical protein